MFVLPGEGGVDSATPSVRHWLYGKVSKLNIYISNYFFTQRDVRRRQGLIMAPTMICFQNIRQIFGAQGIRTPIILKSDKQINLKKTALKTPSGPGSSKSGALAPKMKWTSPTTGCCPFNIRRDPYFSFYSSTLIPGALGVNFYGSAPLRSTSMYMYLPHPASDPGP